VTNAYELRRRGKDVTANDHRDNKSQVPTQYLACWINPETGANAYQELQTVPDKIRVNESVFATKSQILSLDYPNGSRGAVRMTYPDPNGGHVFNWEVQNGSVIWVDAQSSLVGDAADFLFEGASNIQFVRLDNKVPKVSILQYFETGWK
jgi:hypothetical protein